MLIWCRLTQIDCMLEICVSEFAFRIICKLLPSCLRVIAVCFKTGCLPPGNQKWSRFWCRNYLQHSIMKKCSAITSFSSFLVQFSGRKEVDMLFLLYCDGDSQFGLGKVHSLD